MGIHTEPCGLHCIKMNHIGVVRGGKVILEDINIHISLRKIKCHNWPKTARANPHW